MKHSFLKSDLANNSGEASISAAFIYVLTSLTWTKTWLEGPYPGALPAENRQGSCDPNWPHSGEWAPEHHWDVKSCSWLNCAFVHY